VEIEVRVKLGMYALATGDDAAAERGFRQALGLADRLWGPDHVRSSSILNNLAILVGDRPDRGAEQMALLERVIAIRRRAYGPAHPRLAPPLTNLAVALALEGRYEAALASARRSLEVVRGEPGENHRQAYPLVLAGQILLALDRPEEAVPDLERGLALVRERLHSHHPLAGRALLSLAEARIAQLRLAEARKLLGQVQEIRDGDLPSGHPLHTAHRLVSARLLVEEGGFAAGLSALRSLEERAPAGHLVPRDRLLIPVTLARAHLGLGQPGQAQALLEAGLEVGRPEADATLFAEARFLLAQALAERQPERAAELARLALAGLRGASPRIARLRGEMAAWRAASGGPPPRRPTPPPPAPGDPRRPPADRSGSAGGAADAG
jgi:tetratricopeptide (TPR) repeat protein